MWQAVSDSSDASHEVTPSKSNSKVGSRYIVCTWFVPKASDKDFTLLKEKALVPMGTFCAVYSHVIVECMYGMYWWK